MMQRNQWQEFPAQFNFDIVYIKGRENLVVDVLLRLQVDRTSLFVALVMSVSADSALLEKIKWEYDTDE